MSAAAAALRDAFGEAVVPVEPPVTVCGARLDCALTPASGAALADALRALSARRSSVAVRSGGSHDGLGNPLRAPDLLLSTAALAGVHEFDREEGVLRAGAGTPLAALREALDGSGWELPLDPPGEAATLGGTLAAAAVGPRFDRPRDVVLGLDVVLASGARTRCGGRVVKNVTGYDLAKLYVGSLGSLGVIEAAWLRLRPAPAEVKLLCAPLAGAGAAEDELVLAAARRPSVRAALRLDAQLSPRVCADASGPLLLIELADDAAAVRQDEAWLRDAIGARAVHEDALEASRRLQGSHAADGCVLRLTVRPSRLGAAERALAVAGAELLSWPARGTLFARVRIPEPAAAESFARLLAAAQRAALAGEGGFRVEVAPQCARGLDAFGDVGTALHAMRQLKQRFDPHGILNPGRFAGGL